MTLLHSIVNAVTTPAYLLKKHPVSFLAIIITIIGIALLAMGFYTLLSHGVVNATLGQLGSTGFFALGIPLMGLGPLLFSSCRITGYLTEQRRLYEEESLFD